MNEMHEECGGKEGCTSKILFSCNCGNPVVFLCQGCVSDHLLEPRPHLFLQLDQARELGKKSIFSKNYLEVYIKYSRIKDDILAYIDSLQDFKSKVTIFKLDITQQLELAAETKIEKIDDLLAHAYLKLTDFNSRTSDLTNLDQDILTRYESSSVQGLIDNYADTLTLNEQQIKQAIEKMIIIESSSIPNSHEPLSHNDELKHAHITRFQGGRDNSPSHIQDLKRGLEELKDQTTASLEEYKQELDQIRQYTIVKIEDIQRELQVLNIKVVSEIQENKRDLALFMQQTSPKFEEIKKELNKLKKELDQVRPPNFTSIFAAKRGTKDLVRYDADVDAISTYKLDHALPHAFDLSATCVLPDNNILIAGGKDASGNFIPDTYKVDLTKDPVQCTKLEDLNYPRSRSNLICHGDYVYILGGYSSNKVERLKTTESAWSVLPDMNEARWDFGVYIQGNKIYVIGGFNNTSIEYYDMHLNCFNLLTNLQLPQGGIVCGVIDNKIYAVGYKHLRVISKDLELLESQDNINNRQSLCYSNVILKDSRVIYIDSLYSKVFSFDARSRCVAEVKGF